MWIIVDVLYRKLFAKSLSTQLQMNEICYRKAAIATVAGDVGLLLPFKLRTY